MIAFENRAVAEMVRYHINPKTWARERIEPSMDFRLDQWQRDFLDDERSNLLLLIHRQGGKSTIVSIKALHKALFTPSSTIILVSPTQRQSNELLHRVKTILEASGYDGQLVTENVLSVSFRNGSRIISLPGSPWTIRGYTADLVIIDEAAGVPDDVFTAVSPMLLTTQGQYIIVSTPQSKKGQFYESYCSENWNRYVVKASDNPRMQTPEVLQFLENEKDVLGSRMYSQEYECEFLDDLDAGRIKRSWWQFYDKREDILSRTDDIYISFDTASKDNEINDYSVGTVWARIGEDSYLIDMVCDKFLFPDLCRVALDLYNKYRPVWMLIEDKSSGIALIQQLRRMRSGIRIKPINPKGTKSQRVDIASPPIESGRVHLPAILRDGDVEPTKIAKDVIDNMAAFPEGEHDDITDSVSQYLNFIFKPKGAGGIYFL